MPLVATPANARMHILDHIMFARVSGAVILYFHLFIMRCSYTLPTDGISTECNIIDGHYICTCLDGFINSQTICQGTRHRHFTSCLLLKIVLSTIFME